MQFAANGVKKATMIAIVLAAVAIVSVMMGGFMKPVPAKAEGTAADKRVISVSGSGEVTVEPDVAYLNFGIETKGKTANEAQKANAELFAKLNKTLLEDYKLDKKDVKSTSFNVQPEYTYTEKDGQKLVGYIAYHQVQVTYRALDKIGQLLDAVSAAGVNRVNNIQFSTEKQEQYELQAIEKAMKNAETKAKAIAKTAGKELKGVISVQQSSGGYNPIVYGGYASPAFDAKAEAATSIQTGQITINTSVSVQYEF